jgi:hypothetical protein
MLVIVGVIVLLTAAIVAIVGVLSNAGGGPPADRFFRVRITPHGVDRHVVPLWDRGRRGGVAQPLPTGDGRAAHRRRPTKSQHADTDVLH